MLASLLSAPASAFIAGTAMARRYLSDFTSSVKMHGNWDTITRGIKYEIGARSDDHKKDLAAADPTHSAPDMSIPTNFVHSANMSGFAKKYTNFSGIWDRMDLSALIERLAASVAAQSVRGGMTTTLMRGGNPVNVLSLAYSEKPIMSSPSTVFIPRLVDSLNSMDVFAVIAAAANGCGATVVSDVVGLDTNTNSAIVPEVDGLDLADACVEALRIIGANYESNNAGEVFAYAVTRGIHSVVSVVGHTDEGAYLRRVLRSTSFRTPYGGIDYGLDSYSGLPAIGARSDKSVAGWVDSIALATAAAVAHCDPLTTLNGHTYPTIFTAHGTEFDRPGTKAEDNDDASKIHMGRQIAADAPRFVARYVPALASIFRLSTGRTRVAEQHLESAFQAASKVADRHLVGRVVAPYFWIEPTSILEADAFGTPAEGFNYASIVGPGRSRSIANFLNLEQRAGASSDAVGYYLEVPNARSSGLLIHLNAHPDNGLGAVRVRQIDTGGVILPGYRGDGSSDVLSTAEKGSPISEYLWKRGQSCIPAPAEFTNTGRTLGVTICHAKWDDEFFLAEVEHVPAPHEMGGETVFRASAPRGIPQARPNEEDLAVSRARTKAAASLNRARARSAFYEAAAVEEMAFSTSAPIMSSAIVRVYTDGTSIADEREAQLRDNYRGQPPSQAELKAMGDTETMQTKRGTPVAVHAIMASDSGPKAKQALTARGIARPPATPGSVRFTGPESEDPTRGGEVAPGPEQVVGE